MIETLNETQNNVEALKLIIQVAGLLLATFAGGIAMGRFWFARSLEIKNATIEQQQSYVATLTEKVETAKDLEDLKKQVDNLKASMPRPVKVAEPMKNVVYMRADTVDKKNAPD